MYYVLNNLITGTTIYSGPHRTRKAAERSLKGANDCAYVVETRKRLGRGM